MPARFSDAQRRARLFTRHRLDRSAVDAASATHDLVALHSSDPITPQLGLWARVPGFGFGDLDVALCEDRSLCRMHAVRRTMFVIGRDDAPAFEAGATRAIAAKERRRLEGWTRDAVGDATDALLATAEADILQALEGGSLSTKELGARVPATATRLQVGSGKWAQSVPLGSRLLYVMAMDGSIVRTRTAGSWRASQYAWAAAHSWFGSPLHGGTPEAGRAAIVGRYLDAFGPVTTRDLRWWTGFTAAQVRAAIAGQAEPVEVASGEAFVRAGDADPGPDEVRPIATLLPGLDPSPMGWKERDWFLGPHGEALFDRNGNIGPSVWWRGRIVGGWAARNDGVVFELLEDVGEDALAAVRAEADRLTGWLGDHVPIPRFRTPLEKRLVC